MQKLLVCLSFLFMSVSICRSQGDPEAFFKKLYESLEKKDTALFLEMNISADDMVAIFTEHTGGKSASGETPESFKKHYAAYITNGIFIPAIRSIDSAIADDTITVLGGMSYQITKKPNTRYAALKGELFFDSGGRYYSLQITEAIFISNQWKIATLGGIATVKDTGMFNEHSKKISAYGSFDDGKIEVKEVRLIEVENEPPPPPPPPAPKQKPKRKG